jgi:flagellar hook assembly protein FlgD
MDLVKISVYDVNGKIVETLLNKEMLSGKHNVSWNPKSFSSGVYIYKLEAGEYAETKTMVFIK